MCQVVSEMPKVQGDEDWQMGKQKWIGKQTGGCEETAPQCFPVAMNLPSWTMGSLLLGRLPGDRLPGPRTLLIELSLNNQLSLPWGQERKGIIFKPFREVEEDINILSCYCEELEGYKIGEVSILIQSECSFPAINGLKAASLTVPTTTSQITLVTTSKKDTWPLSSRKESFSDFKNRNDFGNFWERVRTHIYKNVNDKFVLKFLFFWKTLSTMLLANQINSSNLMCSSSLPEFSFFNL